MKQLTVAVCVDDRLGTLFAQRRQSRDRVLIADLISTAQDKHICINRFSKTLFEQYPATVICDDLFRDCPAQSVCFAENIPLLPHIDQISTLIIYRWNRHYPADTYFDLDPMRDGFTLISTTEFKGSSHECITKEVYHKA